MRERLMQLLQEAEGQAAYCDGDDAYGVAADYLIGNGVIVPSVRVGQTVWCVIDGFDQVVEGKIHEYTICSGGMAYFRYTRKGYFTGLAPKDAIGKTVFLAREAAEEALKAREQQWYFSIAENVL